MHRSGFHRLDHRLGDELRRTTPGHEHGTDHQVGVGDGAGHRRAVARQRHDPALVDLVDPAQTIEVPVEEQDLRLHALRDPRRVPADVARAEHDDARGTHAGRTAHQDPATSRAALEEVRTNLWCHASGDLAHRREQRKRCRRELHGLVRDPGGAGGEQRIRDGGVGGKVQVREEREVTP